MAFFPQKTEQRILKLHGSTKDPNSQTNLEKEDKAGWRQVSGFFNFQLCYKASDQNGYGIGIKQIHRSIMEQDRETRKKSRHMWPINI